MSHSRYVYGFSSPGEALGAPIVRGEGVYVFDANGKKYLEANSALWNAVAGFDDRTLIDAAAAQYAQLPVYHSFFGHTSAPAVELADRLTAIAPMEAGGLFFTNSGSEAIDTAVKILWMIHKAEGRPSRKIITRRLAYHGATWAATQMTGKSYVEAFGAPTSEFLWLTCPHYAKERMGDESEDDFVRRLDLELRSLIEDEGPESIAGFVAEPVMGAGGVIPPPAGYFESVTATLREYAIPIVADEVICGLGRTGKLWGSEGWLVKPDIVVMAKAITSGYFPLGAVVVSSAMTDRLRRACERYGEFPHGFTTGGHPVGCGIGLAMLDLLLDGGLLQRMRRVIPEFEGGARAFGDLPFVREVRTAGLMAAIEVAPEGQAHEVSPALMRELVGNCAACGLICRPIGSSIVLAPPFIVTAEVVDEMYQKLRDALAMTAGLGKPR